MIIIIKIIMMMIVIMMMMTVMAIINKIIFKIITLQTRTKVPNRNSFRTILNHSKIFIRLNPIQFEISIRMIVNESESNFQLK